MSNLIDLTNQKYGKLLVLEKGNGRLTSGGAYKATWKCKCDCGNVIEVDGEKLRNGHTKSCGCERKNNKGSHFEDLTGHRFNRLTVIRFIPQSERTTNQYNWLCRCDCGKEVKAASYKLKKGLQQSCGCLKEEMKYSIGNVNRKYKYSNKRLYSIYRSMIERCTDVKHKSYHNYGGRGIGICKEWLGDNGFDVFAEWAMSSGYDVKAESGICTLERKDVDGNYSPHNCCWITNKKQQNNKRTCRRIEYNGETHTIAEWAEIYNLPYSTLYNGILRYGKSIQDYIK